MCALVPYHKRKDMTQIAKALTSVAMIALACPQTANAAPQPQAVDLPVLVEDQDLDKLRGGFVWSGLDINFGADIRTYVNGELMLQTILNWTDNGAEVIQTASAGLSPVDASGLQDGIFSNGSIRMKLGDSRAYLLNGGRTLIGHETANGVQNMLINTARGLDSVQDVNATINLGGYQDFRSDLLRDRITNNVNDLVGQASIGALGG